ncbi:MAG: PQQ-like beta-propeller repeat protein [Gemmataceae bacterium]|nr:PQQ-like beta-propeller repeat protein [Gemmataceae bacterium]MCI0737743.1 PQQ-like beta-propeller repeat protein [Gemmataceae bacterium]
MRHALGIAIVVLSLTTVRADDWPDFLGPKRNGISSEKNLNWSWQTKPPKELWRMPLGSGYGSLTIVGERVYTLAKRGERDGVVCLGADQGDEIWAVDAAPTYIDFQRQGAGPRATPVFHAGKLYCQFGGGELVCLTENGKLVWQKNIFKETGAIAPSGKYYWGVSFTPLVHGDAVIVQPGGDKNNAVAAFHKDDGKLLWMLGNDTLGYASPMLFDIHGHKQLVVPTGSSVLGIDPVKPSILWRFPFGNQFNATCSNPVWANNLLFVSAAYGGGAAALQVESASAEWKVNIKWKNIKALQSLYATSIEKDGKIYGISGDLGAIFLRCLDLQTGKIHWEERLQSRSTLLAADGHLLVLDQDGNLSAVEWTPKAYRVKGELPNVLTRKSWAVPALANGRLYLRDERQVVCLDLR